MPKIEKVFPTPQVGSFSYKNPHNLTQDRNDSKDKTFSEFFEEQKRKKEEEKKEQERKEQNSTPDEDFSLSLTRRFVEPSRPKIHRIDPYKK